jgi:hypothetical protein
MPDPVTVLVRRYFIRIEREAKQALPSPELPAIDVRTLLTTGMVTPTLPLPDDIQSAINRRAWAMSHEAYELLRQHFVSRVAYHAVSGNPQRLDKARALEVIANGDLGKALVYSYYVRHGSCRLAGTDHSAQHRKAARGHTRRPEQSARDGGVALGQT